ncbi:hypothetical protein BB561_001669 [Smittium simulii]|uniref:Uncharacterized protein n=1 Tax=Smittium simulii TaxID=133385 RepID=A0A2T9YTI9_9FUNG|nr:hypothetical protein BB561_001669 [Smittium simulii]
MDGKNDTEPSITENNTDPEIKKITLNYNNNLKLYNTYDDQGQAINLSTNIVNISGKDQDAIMDGKNDTEPSITENNTDPEIKKITLNYNNKYEYKK